MKKYGCFVGKFLPPHIGHLSVIDKALQECEKVLVVLAEAPEKSKAICKQDNFPYFPPSKRLEWLKKHYKNLKELYKLPDMRSEEEKENDFANELW